jgi:hypothetical protein
MGYVEIPVVVASGQNFFREFTETADGIVYFLSEIGAASTYRPNRRNIGALEVIYLNVDQIG